MYGMIPSYYKLWETNTQPITQPFKGIFGKVPPVKVYPFSNMRLSGPPGAAPS